MTYKAVPKEYDFSTEFPTWIIAYCPDTDSWVVTNKRFFWYEYPTEFQCERDAINYFKNHIDEFIKLTREMNSRVIDYNNLHEYRVILENTSEVFVQ